MYLIDQIEVDHGSFVDVCNISNLVTVSCRHFWPWLAGPLAKRLRADPASGGTSRHSQQVQPSRVLAPAALQRGSRSCGGTSAPAVRAPHQQPADDIDDDEFLMAMAEQFEAEEPVVTAPSSAGRAAALPAAEPSGPGGDSQVRGTSSCWHAPRRGILSRWRHSAVQGQVVDPCSGIHRKGS